MLIVGDLCGINDYLFDASVEDGGLSRALRARSLFIQVLAECAAWRLRTAAGLPREALVYCAAGQFGIDAGELAPLRRQALRSEQTEIERWLLSHMAGRLGLALAIEEDVRGNVAETYDRALAALRVRNLRQWQSAAIGLAGWNPDALVISAEPPQRQQGDAEIGRLLPRARWLIVRHGNPGRGMDVLGFSAELSEALVPDFTGDMVFLSNLTDHMQPPPGPAGECFVQRAFMRHVPLDPRREPVLFEQIAARAPAEPLLGVLRMDADSLRMAVARRLARARDLTPAGEFIGELDTFFALELDRQLHRREWESILTVHSGGGDLLLVGPWNIMLDFAALARGMFVRRFAEHHLTISAGLEIARTRYPMGRSAARAGELLEQAKTVKTAGAEAARDQIACLGQIWKWDSHAAVVAAGTRMAQWVKYGAVGRPCLAAILDLATERGAGACPDAAARLSWLIASRFPARNDNDRNRREARDWGEYIMRNFDRLERTGDVETVYLPAILRYALLATRNTAPEDRS